IDESIEKDCTQKFGKKSKGVAFPCSISTNKIACHYSPSQKEKSEILKPGDVAKIELGIHCDDFSSFVTHTLVVPGNL
ncbi:MAG: hypothetical protein MHPSP_004497, partial [Paramarteilia canceri]